MGISAPENPALEKSPRRRLILRFLTVGLTVLALAAVAIVCVGFLAYRHVTQPGVPGEKVTVNIPSGATGRDVGRILAASGLVEHELFFRLATRIDTSRKPIKSGRYSLPNGLSALELLHQLQEGAGRVIDPSELAPELKVTVPEGLSIAQAAQLFDNPQAFSDAAADTALIARLGVEADTLEGFLMPDTYYFEKKPTEREVVEHMVAQFEKQYAALVAEAGAPLYYGKLAVVTVASLVEEEARTPDERPAIASVIYNRLKRKMPLQLDSTLQYALGKYGQRLLYTDREVASPYNTYKAPGLPPGPICSPGSASLRAALAPANTNYLYFVSNADGRTHTFSETEAEHLKAVSRFRKEIAPQRQAVQQRRDAASPTVLPAP